MKSSRTPILVAIAALGVTLAILSKSALSDDAHITMRIVRHALEGDGLRYNLGDTSVQPATSPLNLIVMLAVSFLASLIVGGTEASVLLAPTIISCVSLPALGLAAYLLMAGDKKVSVAAAAASAVLMCVPISLSTAGLETMMSMALCMGAILACREHKFRAMGWLLGLAFLARHDAVILAGILYFLMWRETTQNESGKPITALVGFLAIIAPWVIFSLLYYGVATPTTLESKAAQGGTAYWPAWYPTQLGKWLTVYFFHSPILLSIFSVLAVGGVLGALWKRTRASSAVLIFAIYQFVVFAAYSAMRMPDYHWYFVPYGVTVVLLAGWLLSMLERPFAKPFTAAGLGVVSIAAVFAITFGSLPHEGSVWASYREAGRYLEEHPPQQAVGLMEIGIIGFYAPSVRVFDFAGVATLEQAARVSQNAANTWLDYPSVADVVVIRGVEHPLEPDFDDRFTDLYEHEWTGTPSAAFPNGLQVWRLKGG